MNPFEMVVIIVAIVAVSRVAQAKYGGRGLFGRHDRRDDLRAELLPL